MSGVVAIALCLVNWPEADAAILLLFDGVEDSEVEALREEILLGLVGVDRHDGDGVGVEVV